MKYIKKTNIPNFFLVDTNGLTNWDDYEARKKRELKKHILKEEQYNLCCYCESKLNNDLSNSHLEHILPKSIAKYRTKTFDYNNLVVSCDGTHFNEISNSNPEHCGHKKDNSFNEDLFLNPTLIENLYIFFKFNKDTGLILQSRHGGNRAAYTILLLNLNGNLNRIAQARVIAKNNLLKLLKDKSTEQKREILLKILNSSGIQFQSFLKYCFT